MGFAAGFWLALTAAGCGGRSIADPRPGDGDSDDGRDDESHEDAGSLAESCQQACEAAAECGRASYECDFFCGEAETAASDAGCLRAYQSLVQCARSVKDPCSAARACITQVNAFSVCILDYCDTHSNVPLCGI